MISEKIVTVKVRDTDPDGHMAQAAAELTQILTSQFFTPVIANEPQQTSPKAGFICNRSRWKTSINVA